MIALGNHGRAVSLREADILRKLEHPHVVSSGRWQEREREGEGERGRERLCVYVCERWVCVWV
jgi:hypothetical protein